MKILVIRNGGIGDTLLLTHFFQAIRRNFPAAELVAMGRKEALEVLVREDVLDAAVPFDQPGIWQFYQESCRTPAALQKFFFSFSLIFSLARDTSGCFHRNLREAARGEVKSASPLTAVDDTGHAGEYYGKIFGLTPPDCESVPSFFPKSGEDAAVASRFFRERGIDPRRERILAIHAGSGSRLKNWPLKGFLAVAGHWVKEKDRVLWISGPAERETFPIGEKDGLIPVRLPLVRLTALLKSCSAYLGNDSGISHLAGLTGIPSFVIFGPTDPAVWRPLGPRVTILTAGTDCSPCHGEKGRNCPERECFSRLSVEEVIRRLEPQQYPRRGAEQDRQRLLFHGPQHPPDCGLDLVR